MWNLYGANETTREEEIEMEKLEKAERAIKAARKGVQCYQRIACHHHLLVLVGGVEAVVSAGRNGGYHVEAHNQDDADFCERHVTATALSAPAALEKALALLGLNNVTANAA